VFDWNSVHYFLRISSFEVVLWLSQIHFTFACDQIFCHVVRMLYEIRCWFEHCFCLFLKILLILFYFSATLFLHFLCPLFHLFRTCFCFLDCFLNILSFFVRIVLYLLKLFTSFIFKFSVFLSSQFLSLLIFVLEFPGFVLNFTFYRFIGLLGFVLSFLGSLFNLLLWFLVLFLRFLVQLFCGLFGSLGFIVHVFLGLFHLLICVFFGFSISLTCSLLYLP
jgi:hypothetical protein